MKREFCIFAGAVVCLATTATSQASELQRWESGHADLRIDYVAGAWDPHFRAGPNPGIRWEMSETAVVFNDASRISIPDNPNFAFLGTVGNPIWTQPGIVDIGVSSDTSTGLFESDEHLLRLVSVSGPGDFFMWRASSPSDVEVHMNSADGIDSSDLFRVNAGSHAHRPWAFSAPGTYILGFTAEGTLLGQDNPTVSEVFYLRVEVSTYERGELDIDVAYEELEGQLHLGIHQESTDKEFETAHIALKANELSWTRVPNDPLFEFLGELDSDILVLPQFEIEDLLFLGVAGEEIPAGTFEDDSVALNLVGLSGPGQLAVYETDVLGSPTVFFNSTDGMDLSDAMPVLSGSHRHANWVFTAPGIYRIDLQATGVRSSDQQTIQSDVTTFLFEVFAPTAFSVGEIDLDIALADGAFHLGAHQEATDTEFCAAEILFRGSPLVINEIPADPQFSFLGAAGANTFVLPQDEEPGTLFLGIATEEIELGQLVNDELELKLVSVSGPGDFALYQTDAFGSPTVSINTADGIDGTDVFARRVGEHVHANWAFSEPGVYSLGFQAMGTLTTGNQPISSEVIEFRFDIIASEIREEGELDFEVVFENGEWELAFLDEAIASEIEPFKALLIGKPASLNAVPPAAEFSFLGSPNSPVWILPQVEDEDLLFLGIAGDEIALGTFENDAVSLHLRSVVGPADGEFAMYEVNQFGLPTAVYMNSRDGIDVSDTFPVSPGGHAHVNWAFSKPGKYSLEFQASGTPTGSGELSTSEIVAISFIIEDAGPSIAPSLTDGGNSVRLDWMSKNTVNYQVQSRSDLTVGTWENDGSPFSGIGGPQSLTIPLSDETLKVFQIIESTP